MSDIRVRVGQNRVGQNSAIKVVSSVSGAAGGFAVLAENVIGGIASVTSISVSGVSTFVGISTFKDDVYIGENLYVKGDVFFGEFTTDNAVISGILTVGQISYPIGQPYGVAYFDLNKRLVSTGTTSLAISETNYILTTDSSGIPTWSRIIDGGTY